MSKRIKFKARIRPINQLKADRFTGYAVEGTSTGWTPVGADGMVWTRRRWLLNLDDDSFLALGKPLSEEERLEMNWRTFREFVLDRSIMSIFQEADAGKGYGLHKWVKR